MADFEFTQNLSFGQYLPTNSWFHQRDPRAKLLTIFFLMIAITFARNTYMVATGLILVLFIFLAAKIPLKNALRGIRTPLPFLIFIAFFQLFRFSPETGNPLVLQVWSFSITTQGIIAAGTVILRFVSLILVISLASFTLSTSDLIYGLQSLLKPLNWIRIPSEDFIMVVQVTLRFLPLLGQATEQIAKAQAARGAAWGVKDQKLKDRIKLVLPVIVPMFLTSLQKAETMAMAMDSRGYGNHLKRGSYRQLSFKKQDGLLVVTALIVSFLIFIL
jgi:energy-coupling factor transport system permease protein